MAFLADGFLLRRNGAVFGGGPDCRHPRDCADELARGGGNPPGGGAGGESSAGHVSKWRRPSIRVGGHFGIRDRLRGDRPFPGEPERAGGESLAHSLAWEGFAERPYGGKA